MPSLQSWLRNGYKFRWDVQACETDGELHPEGERQSRKNEWRSWRLHYKLLSPEAAPGCLQEKQQLCLGLLSSYPASHTKNGERKKIHISYKENIMWQRRKKLLCRGSIVFMFFTFSHRIFLASRLVLHAFMPLNQQFSATLFCRTLESSHSSEMLNQNKDQSYALTEI